VKAVDIAAFMDSTNLRPEATAIDIKALCKEAAEFNITAVCVLPYRLNLARTELAGSQVKLCTVIGFPLGADGLKGKVYAADLALEQGADELDMVINIGAVKDKDYKTVIREVEAILALKRRQEFVLKAIVETALLDGIELAELTVALSQSGTDYIKTSTGFSTRGVSLKDIETIKAHKSHGLKIKASGGIRDLDFALDLLRAGVDRLGTSNAGNLIAEYRCRVGQ
jgi:deoxyribose-phosphate aldolase